LNKLKTNELKMKMIVTKNLLNVRFSGSFLVLLSCFVLASCSSTESAKAGYDSPDQTINDPLESYNRVITSFNDVVDKALLAPVARGYRYVVPKPARLGVRNFLRNLRTPIDAGNNLLQGDIEGMAGNLSRGVINTFVGIGGLIDVAADAGIPYQKEDFGQTLGVWGVGHGAYLVLPIVGPSSFRDGTGMAVDLLSDPVRIYFRNVDQEGWNYARDAAVVIDTREELLDIVDDLRRNSFDYYAAVRSIYVQRRAAEVRDSKVNKSTAAATDHP